MGFVAWIILGTIIGWLASILIKTNEDQAGFTSIIVGIIGAVAGGMLMQSIGEPDASGLSIYSLLVATGGAVILLLIFQAFADRV